ncbi:hypothetical protein H7849_10170 [Alloacidobacterium dinghuense]|uniref:Uncharacterized protein n=1 Tax=Alloacidobacterium dinghuense TaxID=2763107 RepID=A0A7G8BNV0_9BACT|nr:hypothetical protein [Alloacidobacterium dinghuense]QNI34220.1 hypothetical protein H7849_10170 [Alloacidobacterium dinghuense]
MRITRSFGVIAVADFLGAGLLQLQGSSPAFAQAAAATPNVVVEPRSTIPSGETPLSNDYGIFYAGKFLKGDTGRRNLNYWPLSGRL